MIIQVTPVIFPRIFHGFETLFKIYHPDVPVPEHFEFDNLDEHFNFAGIEHKMGFMNADTIEDFAVAPDEISDEMMEVAQLFDADELFDEFFFDEVYMIVVR